MRNLTEKQIENAILSNVNTLTLGNVTLTDLTGQKAGTETQKLVYARQKAKRIFEALKD